jgi:hypothetical protein
MKTRSSCLGTLTVWAVASCYEPSLPPRCGRIDRDWRS